MLTARGLRRVRGIDVMCKGKESEDEGPNGGESGENGNLDLPQHIVDTL